MAKTTIETDIRELQAMAEKLGSFSKRDGRTLMEEQARGVINNLMLITPPSNGKTRGVAAKKRGEKSMALRLANELMEATEGRGGAMKKRDEVHRMAEANKAFSHFRF